MNNPKANLIPDSAQEAGFKNVKYLVSGLAHDMSAPLRAVVQFSRLLLEESHDRFDEEERYWLQLIQENGEKGQAMLAALGQYSRLERLGAAETVSLRQVLNRVLAQKKATIKASSAEIEIVGDFPEVMGNSEYWYLFFECLLDNALLFQKKEDGQTPIVRIESNQVDGCLQICVEDNGIGVSKSHRDSIAIPFKRLQREKDYPGLGMGLTYCERIAQIHGGDIRFGSSNLGGLSVTFTESDVP